MKFYPFFLLMYIILTQAACSKESTNCKQADYSFEGHLKAFAANETLQVQDTIWLELEMPTRLLNKYTNKMVDYGGAENFIIAVSYIELKGGDAVNSTNLPAAESFHSVIRKGGQLQLITPDQTKVYKAVEESGFYRFSIGIVPQKKGTFAIALGKSDNVYTSNNPCGMADIDLTFADTNQHLQLYEQNRTGFVLGEYERSHMYCFKVL